MKPTLADNLRLARVMCEEHQGAATLSDWVAWRRLWRYHSGTWYSRRSARIIGTTGSAMAALQAIRHRMEPEALERVLTA